MVPSDEYGKQSVSEKHLEETFHDL